MSTANDTPAGSYEWLGKKWCSLHKTLLVRMPAGDNLFCAKCHVEILSKPLIKECP